jgi:hypothetical protein
MSTSKYFEVEIVDRSIGFPCFSASHWVGVESRERVSNPRRGPPQTRFCFSLR